MGSYGGPPTERNQEAVVWVGELASEVTEELLWELMIQAGPVVSVHMPKDRVSASHSGFGFVEYRSEAEASYAMRVMPGVKLFGRPILVRKSGGGGGGGGAARKMLDVGANLFVGSLDPAVDEALLLATFSAFGNVVVPPKVMRDERGMSKGYAFLGFDSFASSDAAIAALNGQVLANRAITVAYALKKDSKTERHGTQEERLLEQRQRMAAVASGSRMPNVGPVV